MDAAIGDLTGLMVWLVMSSAFWRFVGVIVGALASSGTTFWVERSSARRQARDDAHERLRVNIYGAQDALERLAEAVLAFPATLAWDPVAFHVNRVRSCVFRIGDQQVLDSFWKFSKLVFTEMADQELETTLSWMGAIQTSEDETRMQLRLLELLHYPQKLETIQDESVSNDTFNLPPAATLSPDSQAKQPQREGTDG